MSSFRGQKSERTDKFGAATRSEIRRLTDTQRDEIRELFEDIYITHRWRIIYANFMRGLAFGFGTFLGGTVVVAIVVWILSRTTDIFPWMHNLLEMLRR